MAGDLPETARNAGEVGGPEPQRPHLAADEPKAVEVLGAERHAAHGPADLVTELTVEFVSQHLDVTVCLGYDIVEGDRAPLRG